MFDKVFKHEVLFIGYFIISLLCTNVWGVIWFSLLVLVHGALMLYYTIKKAPKDFVKKEDKNTKQQENV